MRHTPRESQLSFKAPQTQFRLSSALAVCLALLFLSSPKLSAQSAPTALTIVEVEVVGAKNTSTDLIKSVAALLPGSQLNSAVIRDAVIRLDGLALFDDVMVKVEEVPGGAKLYIVVDERARLAKISYTGNDKLNNDDLDDAVKLNEGAYVSRFTIYSKKHDILRAYANKGYYLTEVDYALTYTPDSAGISVNFTITENGKVKVRTVSISGTVQMDSSALVGAMSNRKKGFLSSSNFNKDKYQQDLENVIAEYHKNGFIDAYLLSDSIYIDTPVNRMDIFLVTYEGPRYYFGSATFTDNDVYTDAQLMRAMKYSRWDIFDQEKYDESVFAIYEAYQERGHLHIRLLDQKKFNDSIIDIEYQIVEGLPSKINLVNITGNLKTKDKVIRRELSVYPGQVFHRSRLIRSMRDAMALNYFTNVVPDVKNLPNGDVDVSIKVEEKQTGQLNAGAGYSARDRLVGTFGMGIPNLFGNGQTLNFNVEFGGRRNSTQISFTEPWMFGRPTLFGADIFRLNREFVNVYTEGRRGGSLRLGKRLSWPDNFFRTTLTYRLEGNRFFDFSNGFRFTNTFTSRRFVDSTLIFFDSSNQNLKDTKTIILQNDTTFYDPKPGSLLELEEKWNTASILSIALSRDSRNLPEFATSGSKFRYTLSKSGDFLGGFWDYTKHFGEFTKYFNLYRGIALAARFQIGAVVGSNDLRILETEKFAPGGTSFLGVVRGYDDGSLTPDRLLEVDTLIERTIIYDTTGATSILTDVTDTTLRRRATRARGKFMLVTNWEISFPISKNSLYFLTFFDAGNSWARFQDIRPVAGLFPGAGFGFRLAVPGIGTIGFDFAKPLKRRPFFNSLGDLTSTDLGWHTHFQVGTVFR